MNAVLPIPTKFKLVSATAEGEERLTAFDKAIFKAGVGNCNLIKVSSILPPRSRLDNNINLIPGALVPIAYGFITSDIPGEVISAAAAVGLAQDPDSYGIIIEHSGRAPGNEIKAKTIRMVEEAFSFRSLPLKQIIVECVEHKVIKQGCAFAGVVLWY
ncbi:MAG: arginine decarboxylase, pyruvoyl-dependent [Bacillota bacterium]